MHLRTSSTMGCCGYHLTIPLNPGQYLRFFCRKLIEPQQQPAACGRRPVWSRCARANRQRPSYMKMLRVNCMLMYIIIYIIILSSCFVTIIRTKYKPKQRKEISSSRFISQTHVCTTKAALQQLTIIKAWVYGVLCGAGSMYCARNNLSGPTAMNLGLSLWFSL